MASSRRIEEIESDVAITTIDDEEETKVFCFFKDLIPCKLLFFSINTSFSSLFSFLSIFYVTSGLTVVQYGLITGLGSLISLIANPLWGILADSVTKHRVFILLFVGK